MKSAPPAFLEALLAVDRIQASEIFTRYREGASALETVETLMVPALDAVGRGWEDGTVALSQVYMAGKICEELLSGALGHGEQINGQTPRVAIGVLEDYHFLGKRIVASVLGSAGIVVLDYGHLTVNEAVEKSLSDGIELLLLSTLMLPAALRVREVVDRLAKRASGVRVVVGGAPFRFDPQLWREVGADATGATSSDALHIVRRFLKAAP